VCSRPPNLCLVTQFLPNGSADAFLRRLRAAGRAPPLSALVRMMRDAASGVLHLHMEGVIHRDLSARNLLVDADLTVRVSDFGMSRVKRASVGHTDSRVGPVKWMSPEALLRHEYSERSDAFSFGVVMWELLTGELPFPALENLDAAVRVAADEAFRPPLPADLPPQLVALVRACWRHEPAQRPDFAAIVSALDQLLLLLPPRPDARILASKSDGAEASAGPPLPLPLPPPAPAPPLAPVALKAPSLSAPLASSQRAAE
jgi:serine/threonine protein kinase